MLDVANVSHSHRKTIMSLCEIQYGAHVHTALPDCTNSDSDNVLSTETETLNSEATSLQLLSTKAINS